MRKFGLIGYPLGHSFSVNYFARKFEAEKITDCSYENFPLEDLEKFPSLIRNNPSLKGLNVTIPHKTGILRYVSKKDPAVEEIGAANVLKIIRKAGSIIIHAYNSDITGIEDSLRPILTPDIKSALILGTGGSSRAVNYVLRRLGVTCLIVSRERRKDTISYQDISESLLERHLLIVNTTPLGMYPETAAKPDLDYNRLTPRHVLFDLVYNPEVTSFLKEGQERGCKTLNGLKMLWSQAERSWEIWNNDKY